MKKYLLNRESIVFMIYLYDELGSLLLYYKKKRFAQFESISPRSLDTIIEKLERSKAIINKRYQENQMLIKEAVSKSPEYAPNEPFPFEEFKRLHAGMKMLYQTYTRDTGHGFGSAFDEYHHDIANGEYNPYQEALVDCTKTVCKGVVSIGKSALSAASEFLSERSKTKTEGGKRKTKRRKKRKHLTRIR